MEADQIVRLLPEIYQQARLRDRAAAADGEGSLLDALLDVMTAHHAPVEAALADLDASFDPRRAAEPFVKLLASWMSLAPYLSVQRLGEDGTAASGGSGRGLSGTPLRELTARAAELARLRGTADGLRIFLEVATGLDGFVISERPGGFSATVTAPAAARPLDGLISLIVAREKPAFTTVEVAYAEATSVPRPTAD
jgi:phage tail-like protein